LGPAEAHANCHLVTLADDVGNLLVRVRKGNALLNGDAGIARSPPPATSSSPTATITACEWWTHKAERSKPRPAGYGAYGASTCDPRQVTISVQVKF